MYALKDVVGSQPRFFQHPPASSRASLRSPHAWLPSSDPASTNGGIAHADSGYYEGDDDDLNDYEYGYDGVQDEDTAYVDSNNYFVRDDVAAPASAPALDQSAQAKENARLRGELKLQREKQYALQSALREATTQVRTKDILLEQLRERNRTLDAENTELRRVAEERKLEVRSMERFLNKTDRWAGSDLVQAVKDINNEVLQFAAAASEAMHPPATTGAPAGSRKNTPSPTPTPGASRRKALERVAARFGSKMRQALEKRDHAQDPTVLQYALQGERLHTVLRRSVLISTRTTHTACVCQCISHAMSSFCFGSTGKLESHLSKIYSHMHASGTFPIVF